MNDPHALSLEENKRRQRALKRNRLFKENMTLFLLALPGLFFLILFSYVQKNLVGGLSSGAVKG